MSPACPSAGHVCYPMERSLRRPAMCWDFVSFPAVRLLPLDLQLPSSLSCKLGGSYSHVCPGTPLPEPPTSALTGHQH